MTGEQIGLAWPSDWVGQLLDAHHSVTGGFLSGGQVGKLIKPVKTKVDFQVLLTAWGRFLRSGECKYGPSYFLRQMGDYLLPAAPQKVYRGLLTEDDLREFQR